MATTILENVNTDVIPVLDFGCYGGMLSWIADDVFDYRNTKKLWN